MRRQPRGSLISSLEVGNSRIRSISLASVRGSTPENDQAYEVTAELPGLDEKNVELKVANGMLTIKGEKKEE